MSVLSRISGGVGAFFGLMILLGILAIILAIFIGMASFSALVFKWTLPVLLLTVLFEVFLLTPLSIFLSTQGFAARGFDLASMILAIIIWIRAMAYTYDTLGYLGVMGGLLFFGYGVVPLAMVAGLLRGDWVNLGLFCLILTLIACSRWIFSFLAMKVNIRIMKRNLKNSLDQK